MKIKNQDVDHISLSTFEVLIYILILMVHLYQKKLPVDVASTGNQIV